MTEEEVIHVNTNDLWAGDSDNDTKVDTIDDTDTELWTDEGENMDSDSLPHLSVQVDYGGDYGPGDAIAAAERGAAEDEVEPNPSFQCNCKTQLLPG